MRRDRLYWKTTAVPAGVGFFRFSLRSMTRASWLVLVMLRFRLARELCRFSLNPVRSQASNTGRSSRVA